MEYRVSRAVSVVITLVSAAISWLVYWQFLTWREFPDPMFVATLFLFFLFVHELGHAVVMETLGIKTIMVFAIVGAGVMPTPQSDQDMRALNNSQLAAVALAGVAMNLLTASTALTASSVGYLDPQLAHWIALTNAGLIGLNLLPIGTLDGGRFAKALFDSVPENQDRRFARWMSIIIMVAVGVAIHLNHGFTPLAPLVMFQLYRQADKDDPAGSLSPRAMTPLQQRYWAAAFVCLFGSAVILGLH